MKLMLIAGARPNFMKIASIVDAVSLHNRAMTPRLDCILVHTGQHYDEEMSESFFRELALPQPNFNLGVGSFSHAAQTAEVMKSIEPVLLKEQPDVMVVVGDVNSTVACVLVGSKIIYDRNGDSAHARPLIAHVEAGLRSYDRSMPEEINRIVTDVLSDVLLTSEEGAEDNLLREGIPKEKIFFVGNTMADTLLKHKEKAMQAQLLVKVGLKHEQHEIYPYAAVTLHRPSNVDNPETFHGILKGLKLIAEKIPVFFPVHPRTMRQIKEFHLEKYFRILPNGNGQPSFDHQKLGIHGLVPLGYFDFLSLISNARLVLTDSGGIQEETTVLGVPCVTLRKNTERPITISHGTNVLAGTRTDSIIYHAFNQLKSPRQGSKPKYWDGRAGIRIVETLVKQFTRCRW